MNGTYSGLLGEIHGHVASVDANACARAAGLMHVTGAVAKVGGKSWFAEHEEVDDTHHRGRVGVS